MNKREFTEWLDHHSKCYPTTGQYVRQNDCEAAWFNALRDVDLDAAKSVSNQMLSGVIDKPIAHADHVACIRRNARQQSYEGRQVVDRVECNLCLDTGFRLIAGIKRPKDDEALPGMVRKINVACNCRQGDRQHITKRNGKEIRFKRFDQATMIELEGNETIDEIFELIQSRRSHSAPFTEFDSWSAMSEGATT